jgi:hypothetical protein
VWKKVACIGLDTFFFVFCLSCVGGAETLSCLWLLLTSCLCFHSVFTKVWLLMYCSYLWPWLFPPPTETWGFWLDIGGRCETLLCCQRGLNHTRVLLLANFSNNEVIPLSPTLLVCHVWLLQMVIRCVFFGKPLWLIGFVLLVSATIWLWTPHGG